MDSAIFALLRAADSTREAAEVGYLLARLLCEVGQIGRAGEVSRQVSEEFDACGERGLAADERLFADSLRAGTAEQTGWL